MLSYPTMPYPTSNSTPAVVDATAVHSFEHLVHSFAAVANS